MKEDITSFCIDENTNFAFNLEMTGISYCDGTYKIKRNNSPIYVFEYIISGTGAVKTGAAEFYPSEGDIYILHRGSSHEYYSDDRNPWIKVWFNAKGTLIDHLMEVYKLGNINHIQNYDLSGLFFKMIEIARMNSIDHRRIFEQASIVLHELLIKIAAKLEGEKESPNYDALKIKQYLDQHIEDKVAVKDLGDLVYHSPSHIIRIYKKEYGVTPYDYLLNKKLEMAILMLLNTNMSVKEIAFKLKFADEHYFCNFFKSKTGQSPSTLRKEAR